ncbi:MAG TPA: gluconate permease, partial [Lactobacillus sp.]|nr:gluconate permease [Lactobacillus sp.]
MEILALIIGILFLLVLIIQFKMNTFVSLILTSVLTAILLGMNLTKIAASI